MDLVEIKNIMKKDSPLHYREEFSALAVFNNVKIQKIIEMPVEFSFESNAFGKKNVEVFLKKSIDYPLLPLKNSIKDYILSLDKQRKIR